MHVRWSFRKQKNLGENTAVQKWHHPTLQKGTIPGDPWPLPWDWTKSRLRLDVFHPTSKSWRFPRKNSSKIVQKKTPQSFGDVWFSSNPQGGPFSKKNTCQVLLVFFVGVCFLSKFETWKFARDFRITVLNGLGWLRDGAIFILLKLAQPNAQKFPQFPTQKAWTYHPMKRFLLKVLSSFHHHGVPIPPPSHLLFLSACFNWSSNEKAPKVTRRILQVKGMGQGSGTYINLNIRILYISKCYGWWSLNRFRLAAERGSWRCFRGDSLLSKACRRKLVSPK